MIVPIKIDTPIKEKTAIKNVSLGSIMVSTSSIDEFIVHDNELSACRLQSYIYIYKFEKEVEQSSIKFAMAHILQFQLNIIL